MLEWIALACLGGAVILLAALAAVDLKTRLLPNEMVAGFAILGLVFHLTTLGEIIPPTSVALGGFAGFALMYSLRAMANRVYGQDALGLGDVKLIGAGGLWLGMDAIMLAMAVGAMASLFHGLGYALWEKKKTGRMMPLSELQVPAGPGFAAGIIILGVITFRDFWAMLV